MGKNIKLIDLLVFFVLFLIVGIPYWLIPYSKLSLPDSLYGIGLVAVFIAALVLGFNLNCSFKHALLISGLSVPVAVLCRVFVDVFRDSTSHNLWPFEMIIAALVGFGIALVGVSVASLFIRLFKK